MALGAAHGARLALLVRGQHPLHRRRGRRGRRGRILAPLQQASSPATDAAEQSTEGTVVVLAVVADEAHADTDIHTYLKPNSRVALAS